MERPNIRKLRGPGVYRYFKIFILALAGRPELSSNKFGGSASKQKLRLGIRSALEILTELTEAQKNVQERIVNRGRVVVLTYTEDLKSFSDHLNNIFQQEISEVNSLAAGSSNLASVAQLEIDVVCCYSELRGHFMPFDDYSKQMSHVLNYSVAFTFVTPSRPQILVAAAPRHGGQRLHVYRDTQLVH